MIERNAVLPRPYTSADSGSDGRPYVEGPGDGTGYHSGTLFSDMRLSTPTDAEAASKIANEAFRQGALWARAQMREALGI